MMQAIKESELPKKSSVILPFTVTATSDTSVLLFRVVFLQPQLEHHPECGQQRQAEDCEQIVQHLDLTPR
jgi:hypothetical protein